MENAGKSNGRSGRLFKTIASGIGAVGAAIPPVMAHCPVCTAATGAAVGVARWYGVDDALVGLLIGGFVVSSALWINNVLKKRNYIFFSGQAAALVLASLLFTVVAFKSKGLLIGPLYWGLPRLLTGLLLGTVVGSGAEWLNGLLRSRNNGFNYLPMQGVNLMLAALLLASIAVGGGWA